MSAPLTLTPAGLLNISSALTKMTAIRKETGVEVGAYGTSQITYRTNDGNETVLQISWDGSQYVIEDRIGD